MYTKINNFSMPPGGLAIWIFICAELTVFILALIAFIIEKNSNLEQFQSAHLILNQNIALINTFILMSSGAFVAHATSIYESGGARKKSAIALLIGTLLGVVFLIFKFYEYYLKISLNNQLTDSIFFDYYWLLTSFHALHVLIGIPLLLICATFILKNKDFPQQDFNLHTAANYWHMCDLIWILIYTQIYLL